MAICIGMFGLVVAALSLNAAAPPEDGTSTAQPVVKPAVESTPARFFAASVEPPAVDRPQVPIEALLLQIDNHVRLEQAAAESFLQHPTAALLHSRTISTLIH